MRTQLENIERAEKYLSNELNTAEHAAFEQELLTNPKLKTVTEGVRNLQAAAYRSELRKKIESNPNGNNNWGKATIIGVLIICASMLTWLFFTTPNTTKNQRPTDSTTSVERVSNTLSANVPDSAIIEHVSPGTNPKSLFQQVISVFSQPDTIPVSQNFQLGGHEIWTKPNVQSFQFESLDGATIEGENGMLIIVPQQAFVDLGGNPITGKVEFNLVEAFSIEEMVLYKLQTVSNGSKLESGGMFYLEATINGVSVQVNPARPLYIEIPTIEKKTGMMAFQGKITKDGNINWVNPKPLKKYLVKLPLEDLNFLPAGFEAEVKGNMPFLNYGRANKVLTDSLYYSLSKLRVDDKSTIPKKWTPRGETREYDTKEFGCGIDPASVNTIKTEPFEQTFVATKEFETRIAMLHQEHNGDDLLDVYLKNLTKDLNISDSVVALEAGEDAKEVFERFAKEKLTNIKDAPLYQKRLTEYYTSKRRELKNTHERLATQLTVRNAKELEGLSVAIATAATPTATNSFNNLMAILPTPNAATTNVYSTPWISMGWGNIDRYYKLLNNGTVETSIAVLNMPNNTSVTQWLGAINTYTDLSISTNGFRAVFPKNPSGSTETHVFAIAESDHQYTWGMKHYNPYEESDVQFEMATTSIEDIKKDLRRVSTHFGKIRTRLLWKEEQVKQAIIKQMQVRKKREEWLEQRNEIMMKYNDELRKQQEIEHVLSKLRNAAFPCQENDVSIASEIEIIDTPILRTPDSYFTIVEDMPQYPGADAAIFQFVRQNIRYPEKLKLGGITGTSYVSYVVNQLGTVTDVRIVRSSGNDLLDEEAARVVRLFEGYTPGRQRGKPVSVQFTIPIRFQLN
jgi:TonB family protein